MKNNLNSRDIKRISNKQIKEKTKRDKFELYSEVYILRDSKYPTYVWVKGSWPMNYKKGLYYTSYHLIDPDSVIKENGYAVSRDNGPKFDSIRKLNKFVKSKLRELSEIENYALNENNMFKKHFEINDLESIEMTEQQRDNLDNIFDNSRTDKS